MGDRSDYQSMVGISFLWASATAGPMAVLSLILRQKGVDVHAIGIIMGANVLASIVGAHVAGTASVRYGPLRVVLAAILCTGVALVSFEWTTAYPLPALASRLLQGFGFGLFLTSGISYVQNKTPENNQQYAIGMFSAMAITPYFFAQWEAEYWLDHYGPNGIFLVHALGFLFVLGLALFLLSTDKPAKAKPKGASYLAILAHPSVYPPYMCHFVNGTLFGFGASFLPILLKDSAIMLGVYFTPFALVTLGSRFLLVKHLQRLPKPALLALGMASLGVGACLPVFALDATTIALSGALYGFGYSFVGPAVLVSVGEYFTPQERPRANALAQNFFQFGSLLAPLAASYAIGLLGSTGLLIFMSLIGTLAIAMAIFVFALVPGSRVAETRA